MKLFSVTLCLFLVFFHGIKGDFKVKVNPNGSYNVVVNGVTWLTSADTIFRGNKNSYSTGDNTLKLTSASTNQGSDSFGPWSADSFIYQAGQFRVSASIKSYTDVNLPAAVFTQTYLDDVTDTATSSPSNVTGEFPSFKLQQAALDLGYLAYAGSMSGNVLMSMGRFDQETGFTTGIKGGPLVIFDNSSNVVVISPLSQFMAASNYLTTHSHIAWGIMGHVNSIPKNYSVDFIIFYSDRGINQAIKSWGNYLTSLYKKTTARRDTDPTIRYLGYWTDNGAYYYYNTESGKNYETTIIDTVNDINNISIPFRYLQYDSWWYPKGKTNGVLTWTAKSDIFPHGFRYVSDNTKLPFGCHNRFWDSQTPYAKYNGGQYNFVPDNKSGYAVPDDAKFWQDLLSETQNWGPFILYEQVAKFTFGVIFGCACSLALYWWHVDYESDWLDMETDNNAILQSDLFIGRRWLTQMGRGAELAGPINIQYCMAYSRHILQSLEIPVVTQARVSGDYHPGNNQWTIGVSSIWVDALNLAPFKDTFYSTSKQPGDPYHSDSEPNVRLQSLIATISTGPVGPGDGIGYINKQLIMRCCDASGLILKPAKPATAVDDQIKRSAFHESYPGPAGELYSTYTKVSGFLFGIILAAHLSNDYNLTPHSAWPNEQFPESLAFSESQPSNLFSFSDSAPIRVGSQCSSTSFCLYYTSPLLRLDNGTTFAILGELDKWVPMSRQRFNDIQTTGDNFFVQLMVQPRESVTLTYYNVNQKQLKTVVCDNSQNSQPALSTLINLVAGTCNVD